LQARGSQRGLQLGGLGIGHTAIKIQGTKENLGGKAEFWICGGYGHPDGDGKMSWPWGRNK
jgi:hypothetical protein